ncbi:hypothetical protein F5X68DRAFT_218425 [Plectosphaerella plurivora]|uniref:Uncharacterized protein n=1 Tax=Plectosphaerella plurivora TaxID=936078 RepID=A0A9P8V0H4_9PEZI|nr:hypothetical protein F5X68DRAFT_218425 [Plectosphaerella plurivora]
MTILVLVSVMPPGGRTRAVAASCKKATFYPHHAHLVPKKQSPRLLPENTPVRTAQKPRNHPVTTVLPRHTHTDMTGARRRG